jgi:hypothetical protein
VSAVKSRGGATAGRFPRDGAGSGGSFCPRLARLDRVREYLRLGRADPVVAPPGPRTRLDPNSVQKQSASVGGGLGVSERIGLPEAAEIRGPFLAISNPSRGANQSIT